MRGFVLGLLLFGLSSGGFAQQSIVDQYKDTLIALAHRMQRGGGDTTASRDDSIRFEASRIFQNTMEKIFSDSSSFTAHFEAIKYISVVSPEDHSFRLYTWNYPNYEGSVYHYFGYLQTVNKKTKKISLVTLYDASATIEKPASKKLKSDQWYGSVYYNMVENKKSGKKFYTLFGWHGKDQFTTQKIIDVLSFDGVVPVFGLPVFKSNNLYNYRVIFEYTSQAVMTVKYEPTRKLIVFDHLTTTNKKNEPNMGRMTGPDGSYDGYKLKKDHWELVENINAENGFVPVKGAIKPIKDSELKK